MLQQLTLSQFTSMIAQSIRELWGDQTWLIVAEVNKIKQRRTRFYLELVEYEHGNIKAQTSAVITNQSVLRSALKTRWVTLEEIVGQQILLSAIVRYHKDHGIQLEIVDISPEYTLWHLKKKEQTIKDQLISLGIYHQNKEKDLWLPPLNVALISSKSSEWLKDFLQTMDESWYRYTYTLYDCAIHGTSAIPEIYNQLKSIYQTVTTWEWTLFVQPWYDAVILVRGWGGSSGIMWHNDLWIAKAICYMPIPVIIAVGHTNDQYLLDEIAWMSAKTPTDAAYQLIWIYDNLNHWVDELYSSISQKIKEYLDWREDRYESLYTDIVNTIADKRDRYATSISLRYQQIVSTRPEKMLQSWYALLQSLEGEYLTSTHAQSLQSWDLLTMRFYDQQWTIKLISKKIP